MSSNSASYLLKQGFQYFKSNKIMTLASVGVLASCLFIISNFYLISLNLQENIKSLQQTNQIILYIDDSASDDRVKGIMGELDAIQNVASYQYYTKEQALEQYLAQFSDEDEKALFSSLQQDNPLPRFFSVTLKDLKLYDGSIDQLKNIKDIYKLRSEKDMVQNMLSIGRIVMYISVWIIGLMLLASLFIIVNTIRLASYYYRRQINIMKFVGATNWFIRWPFIIQGAITGFLAGILTYFLQKFTYLYVFEALAKHFSIIKVIGYSQLSGTLLLAFMAGGLFVGIVGSGISIGKYLKV